MTLSRSLSAAVRSAADYFDAEPAAVSLVAKLEGGQFAAIARSANGGASSLGVFRTEEAALVRLSPAWRPKETDPDPFAGRRDSLGNVPGFLEDDPMTREF